MLHPLHSLGWPLLAAPKPLPKSTERRLRKLSLARPASFRLTTHAQVLCVGAAIVYRAEIAVARSPSCLWSSAWRNFRVPAWVIALSEAKLRAFCAELHAVLQHPAVARTLQRHGHGHGPIEQFYRRLAAILHHAQPLLASFAHQAATATHLSASKHAAECFLDECWRALEVVIPVLAARPHLPTMTALSRETLSLYVLLRDLLAFPESLLEADRVYAKAVLGLRDVEAGHQSPGEEAEEEPTCCICLDALSSTSEPSSDATSVRLPCDHAFHENCIMAWLRQNPTCPSCRARADVDLSSGDAVVPMSTS